MQKNWYAVYTRPQFEKKVSTLLNKWKIENFYPLKSVKPDSLRKSKTQYGPLFKSYVFVCISEDQIPRLSRLSGVVNFLHWLGKPAVINKEEIDVLKEFTTNYQNVKLERISVNLNESVEILDEPSYTMEGMFISVKTKTMKVNLPSLGYTLIAEIEKDTLVERQNSLFKVSA